MANTRFGNFQDLAGDRKPITAKEAWDAFNGLGYMAQAFIPGAISIQRLIEGKPKEAVEELQDWIPGNAAYQNWLHDRPQDWERNVIDALIMGKPILKGAKKAAEMVERIPKGSKEGFITLTKPTGQNKLKDVIEASNEAGQKITPEIEKEIRDHIALTNAASKNPSKKTITQQANHYDRMSPEAKQVVDSYLGQQQPHGFKPADFDTWPAEKRKAYLEEQYIKQGVNPEDMAEKTRSLKDENYGGRYDYGVIYPDAMSLDDYAKALWDIEHKPKPDPVTSMDVFTGESYGNVPTVGGSTVQSTRKTRPSYDHSREFNGGSFQKLEPINRSELKGNGDLGERIFDAQSMFYLPDTKPGKYLGQMSTGRFTGTPYPKTPALDPYHEAGIINDRNVKLNNIIDRERSKGKTDAEIYRDYKNEFDEYQGMLERYKTRLNNPQSSFDYDGAITSHIVATPSEEINVLRKLGMLDEIDPKMAGYMDDIRDHYKSLMERIFDYESKFPQSPKLSNEQLVRLKDMGIKPEEIDIFLAEHPEFMLQ